MGKITERSAAVRHIVKNAWSEAPAFVKRRLLIVLLMLAISAILTGLGPFVLKSIVDELANVPAEPLTTIALLIPIYIAIQWLARILAAAHGMIYARAAYRGFRLFAERVFSHIMQLPQSFHVRRHTGAMNQTLENGLQGYQLVLSHLTYFLLPVVMQLATITAVLAHLGKPEFFGLFVLAVVGYGIGFAYMAVRLSGPATAASEARIAATEAMTDGILNYEIVKCFTAERAMQERVARALTATESHWVEFFRRCTVSEAIIATAFAGFLGATLYYSVHEVSAGRLTLGEFVLVNAYMFQIIQPMEMLGFAIQGISEGMGKLGKALELLGEPIEPQQTEGLHRPVGHGSLAFENVGLRYPTERGWRVVLEDISFSLPAGKTLGIVGVSGAGKSSLVRLMVRLYEPQKGRILLDGVPISMLSLSTVRRAVAVVPQETLLMDETIAYNIAFGRPECTQAEIESAANLANLHKFIMGLPEKYSTRVGERGVKLSGGEMQRISIARAALKRPSIYVFDEATSSLDSRTEQEIMANLREIAQSRTTLIIAHRLSTVVHADEIIVLQEGTIAERGTHRDLLAMNGIYATLWKVQYGGDQVIPAAC